VIRAILALLKVLDLPTPPDLAHGADSISA